MSRLVESTMTENPTVALWSETLSSAYSKMQTLDVRHLPVISDNGKMIGIISDRDLQRAMRVPDSEIASRFPTLDFPEDATISDFMSSPVISVESKDPISKAARIMVDEKVSAIAVIEETKMIGIVTSEDLLRILVLLLEEKQHPFGNLVNRLKLETPIGALALFLSDAGL